MKKQSFDLALKRVLRLLKIEAEAAIFLLGGRELARIKQRFTPTPVKVRGFTGKKPKKIVDVLSFPEPRGFPHPGSEKRFLGEIYINKDIVGRDKKMGNFLLLHGLLHLLGYTHVKKSDTIKMRKKEAELLRELR